MNSLLILALSMSFAQEGTGRRFLDMFDANGDGYLSRVEWTRSGDTFLQFDRDRDGYLSVSELDRKPPRRGTREPAVDPQITRDALAIAFVRIPNDAPRLFVETCTACHDLDRVARARKPAGGWEETVERMRNKEEAEFSTEDARRISEYLSGLRVASVTSAQGLGTDDPERDWALIFQGAEVHRFDRNRDGALQSREITALLIACLDFDGDGSLNRGEYSLLPVTADHARGFAEGDRNRDKKMSARELGVPRSLMEMFDHDDSGAIEARELPRARPRPQLLWLAQDAEAVLAQLDRNRDEKLSGPEWRKFGRWLERYDEDGDGTLIADEIQRVVDAGRAGFDRSFDDFLTRYDLDRDGEVEPGEFPGPRLLFLRCDRNRDGAISPKDGPPKQQPTATSDEAARWR